MTNASRAPVDFDAFARDLKPSGGAPRASEPAAQKPDPLAELARIVGQDDPFRALLAARDDRRQPAPQAHGRVEPSFAEEAGPAGAPRNTPADAFDQYLASVDHGGAQQAAYGEARDFQGQDFQAQDLQAQDLQAQGFQAGPEEAEVHDQRGLKRVKPRRRLVTVGAGVAVVVVAVTGALTYKGLHRGGTGGGVPVIQADTAPVKVAPKVADGVEIPDQNRQIYEPKAKDSQIRIVNREEQPLDVAQAARAAQGAVQGVVQGAVQGQERSGQDRGTEAAVTPGSASFDAFGQPRKVRTVVVKPDTPPPAAQREVQAEAMPLSPIPTMTLPGEDAPVRTRPGRMAAATPQMPVQTAAVQQAPSQAVPVQAPPAPERMPAAAAPAPVRAKSPQRIAAVTPDAAPAESPATTATVSNAAVGGFSVQLGVRGSAREAQAALREMQGKYGQLAGKPELIRQAEVNGKTIFRVRVGPLAKAEATSLCTELQGAGGQCFVAKN